MDCNNALLFEILMKVEPGDIFKCILVSKDWLSVIISPHFRTNYLNKWKDSLVGLLLYRQQEIFCSQCSGFQFVATSNLGAGMIARNPILAGYKGGDSRFFISNSLKGGLLLFRSGQTGSYWSPSPYRYFVCKSISGGTPVELPLPPGDDRDYMANIVCDDDDGEDYRVIFAYEDYRLLLDEETDNLDEETDNLDEETEETDDIVTGFVGVRTYCSSTGNWKQSTLSFEEDSLRIRPSRESGVVTKGGNAIYWEIEDHKHCFVTWDMNRDCIGVIPRPALVRGLWRTRYDIMSDGSLLAAAWASRWDPKHTVDAWESELFSINILAFDDDKKVWDLLYSVRPAAIWNNNIPLFTRVFDNILKRDLEFVAFVPGKSHSFFLAKRGKLFVYHFATGKLEHVEHVHYDDEPSYFIDPVIDYHHPLTLLDVGVWPSSPSL